MKSLLASVRSLGGLDRVDHAVQLLEDEWRRHGDVPLERLWTEQRRLVESEAGDSVVLLAELVKTDLRCRFTRGQTPTVAGYLERFPELQGADSRVLSLIYEEFCLIEERGDAVDVDAFCDRYPRWKDSLVSQLQYHHLFSQAAGVRPKPTPFPEAGDTFEEFRLVSLLGRGGTSRVFLARDLSLGGKQVVLKVSLDRGREPQAQGALDHPHIVPVNSVVFGAEGMRGLSMPYRAGRPLDEVIRRVNPASKPRHAMAIWEALIGPAEVNAGSEQKLSEGAPPAEDAGTTPTGDRWEGFPIRATPRGDGWEGFPIRGSYAQGVAWVVKVVAEALHYAHSRKTFHRDVKPANVLLTIQHGPQLLDFNLAESPHSASQAQAAMHGGTLPYMAPEQIEAFLNPDLWGKVGAPADVYSLGLVLREMLTGQAPDVPAETLAPARAMRVLLDRRPMLDVSVRRSNRAIPHALEAIVARCLAVGVEDRYPDAGTLAEDLDCFLHQRPLIHAVNPSRRERYANWGERHRRSLAITAACLAFLAMGTVVERSRNWKRPLPPIQRTRELGDSLAMLQRGDALASLALFGRLAAEYPESSIPRVYRALAYDALGRDSDAEHCFAEVLGMSDALREMVECGSIDPELLGRLNRFADHRFDTAESIKTEKRSIQIDRGQTEAMQFEMAYLASEIAQRIFTNSHRPQPEVSRDHPASDARQSSIGIRAELDASAYNLARAEQERKAYESVIRRADKAISLLVDEPVADFVAGLPLERRLYDWRQLRCRALVKRAEEVRKAGSRIAQEEARQSVLRAEKDLQICSSKAASENRNDRDLHYLQRIRVIALMTRVEIELDLGEITEAKARFKRAREAVRKYEELALLVKKPYDVESMYTRLTALDSRLSREEMKRNDERPAAPTGD